MSPELRRMLVEGDEVGFEKSFVNGDFPNSFSVDWRECDDDIVRYCAECLSITSLEPDWKDDALFIRRGEKKTPVPLREDGGDRHITLCALNDALAPDYEARYLVVSGGSDTLGLVALRTNDWRKLEEACPQAVAENFIDPRLLPNLITEFTEKSLPIPARARYRRMVNRSQRS